MIPLNCTNCGRTHQVSEDKQGKTTRCFCGNKLKVDVYLDVLPADDYQEKKLFLINKGLRPIHEKLVQKKSQKKSLMNNPDFQKFVKLLNVLASISSSFMFFNAAARGRMIINREV